MDVPLTQKSFLHCYRGHYGSLRELAYMRLSKVLLIQWLLSRNRRALEGKSIFDYGFGAGTFLRRCPVSSRLYGVELDVQTVSDVATILKADGFPSVCLHPIRPEAWQSHPLLEARYDVIVCSHVLEHLPDPAEFLGQMRQCLAPGGELIVLVPIHERRRDPHHVQEFDLGDLKKLCATASLELIDAVETDHWLYWLQPVFTWESGPIHKLAQGISLGLGLASTLAGSRLWFHLSGLFGKLTASKPTQAALLLAAARE